MFVFLNLPFANAKLWSPIIGLFFRSERSCYASLQRLKLVETTLSRCLDDLYCMFNYGWFDFLQHIFIHSKTTVRYNPVEPFFHGFLAFESHLCPGVLADNLFFLFNSVLSAATTGLVARAWPKGVKNARQDAPVPFRIHLWGWYQPFLVRKIGKDWFWNIYNIISYNWCQSFCAILWPEIWFNFFLDRPSFP